MLRDLGRWINTPARIQKGKVEMENNRIGSHCWYQPAGPTIPPQKWRGGTLRAWGTDMDNGERFPVAVIEDDGTGMCASIYVTRVSFATDNPDREQEEQRRLVLVRSRSSSLAAVGAKIDSNTLASMTDERFAEELAALTKADEKRKADVAEEAARIAALDVDKIDAYVDEFVNLVAPGLSSKKARDGLDEIIEDFSDSMRDFRDWILRLEKGTP